MKRERTDDELPESGFDPPPVISTVDAEAARWVAQLTSGDVSKQQRAEFARWRAANPAHEAALARMRSTWIGLGRALDAPTATRSRRPRRRAWALAASMLVMVAAGWQTMTQWRYDEVTAAGERRQIILTDGSSVLLSGDTAMDLHIDGQRREIDLVRGEAYFDVAPDEARTFVVRTGAAEVRVLGTRFAVRADDGRDAVVVEQGKVEVRGRGGDAVLRADQRILVHDGVLAPVQPADVTRDLAWRRGRLVFDDATLGHIIQELNRHYARTVLIAGAVARNERFDAIIDLDRVDTWLAALDETGGLEVVNAGPLVLIH